MWWFRAGNIYGAFLHERAKEKTEEYMKEYSKWFWLCAKYEDNSGDVNMRRVERHTNKGVMTDGNAG